MAAHFQEPPFVLHCAGGYSMAESNKWQLLFVDDDEQRCGQVKEYLEGETLPVPDMSPQVTTYTDFNDALNELETRLFDLVILDVRLGPLEGVREEEAGITTLETI